MPKLTELQTNFASGEIDPSARGQSDIKAYLQGLRRARDVQRRSTGGLERRPGTLDVAALSAKSRLEAFEFSSTERYLIAFRNGAVDIFNVAGSLLQTIGSAPWDATTTWELSTAQYGDVMVICHVNFWPKVLRRTGLTTFTLTDLVFESSSNSELTYQPFYKFVDPSITLTPSGSTGAINLNAKDAAGNPYNLFTAAHVGLRFRIYDVEVVINSQAGNVAGANVLGTLEGSLDLDPFKTKKGSNDVEVTHLFHGLKTGASITFSGCNTCGSIPGTYFDGAHTITVIDEHHYKITLSGVSYNYYEDATGSGTPSSVAYTSARLSEDGGGPNVKFGVVNVATRRWLEPSISAVRGYPGACCFHEMRLVLAGTGSQPDAIFMSNSLQFFRFDAGKGYDADSVQVAIGVEDISRIRHVVSNDDLQIFTATTEAAFQVRSGEAITPNNARIKAFTRAGSMNVQPVPFDSATLFVQENGLTVQEFVWSDSQGKYLATPVSTLASHLIQNPVQMAATPGLTALAEQFAFVVNASGNVAVFHSLREENIAGWVLWTIVGMFVESVCCIGNDVFFAGIQSDTATRRIWKLADEDLESLDGAWHGTNGGVAKTNWTVPANWQNRLLWIIRFNSAGGFATEIYQQFIPNGGAITLPHSATDVIVGHAFFPEVRTLPPRVPLPSGDQLGKVRRRVRSIIDFEVSQFPTVDGVDVTNWDGSALTTLTPWDGPFEIYHMGFDRDGIVILAQSLSLAPWRVLSVNQEVLV